MSGTLANYFQHLNGNLGMCNWFKLKHILFA